MKEIEETLSKVSERTIGFFGSSEKVYQFIELLCDSSSTSLVASKMGLKSLPLNKVINADPSLLAAIDVAKEIAMDLAGGVLYERAVHGYDEEVYDADEKKVKRLRKYSDRALIDYLRANDPKYRTKSNGQVAGVTNATKSPNDMEINEF